MIKFKDYAIWFLLGMIISALLCIKIIPREIKVKESYTIIKYSKPDTIPIYFTMKPKPQPKDSSVNSFPVYEGEGYFVIGDTDSLSKDSIIIKENTVTVNKYPSFGINTNIGFLYDDKLDFLIGIGFNIKKNRFNYNLAKPLNEMKQHQLIYERSF